MAPALVYPSTPKIALNGTAIWIRRIFTSLCANNLICYSHSYSSIHFECNHTVGLDAFFKQIFSDVPKVGIIGSGCSLATEPTADNSPFYNLTQV